jgi:hypothetical protein
VVVAAAAGLQDDIHDDELARAGRRHEPPPDRAPIELLLPERVPYDERAHRCSLLTTSALKRRMFSVIATSVGNRSIELAPKKPVTPSVRSSTHAASSAWTIGPP